MTLVDTPAVALLRVLISTPHLFFFFLFFMQRGFTAGRAAFKVIVTGEPLDFFFFFSTGARKGQTPLSCFFYLAYTIIQSGGSNAGI